MNNITQALVAALLLAPVAALAIEHSALRAELTPAPDAHASAGRYLREGTEWVATWLPGANTTDMPQPRLGWWIDSDQRGEAQTAYQVLVATTPEILTKDQGDVWDSGE